jgi:hypothetical protein
MANTMNRKQMIAIQSLTDSMRINAFGSARDQMAFNVEADRGGFIVTGQNMDTAWTAMAFMAIAFVGPRGGVKHYREYR